MSHYPECPIDCGDNSCRCASSHRGMRTNGGCRCEEFDLRRAVVWWRNQHRELSSAVRDLMAYWPELDNIPDDVLDEHEIIVSARLMRRLKALIGA